MGKKLHPEDLKRGDIIQPIDSTVKYIVSSVADGLVFTIEKRTDRKGPVLSQEGLLEYFKANIGEKDCDEYRAKIISTYLERHKNGTAVKEAKRRYAKKKREEIKEMESVFSVLREQAEKEALPVKEYILMAAEFYEKHKQT